MKTDEHMKSEVQCVFCLVVMFGNNYYPFPICEYCFARRHAVHCGSVYQSVVCPCVSKALYTLSLKKTVHFYFSHNFVKFPRILISFGR